jgi:hypothetical protein
MRTAVASAFETLRAGPIVVFSASRRGAFGLEADLMGVFGT